MIDLIFRTVCIVIIIFCLYMLYRNNRVFNIRKRGSDDLKIMLDSIKLKDMNRLVKMNNYFIRLRIFSYEHMMYRFFTSFKTLEKEFREFIGIDKI